MSDFIDQDLYVGNDIFVNGDSVSDTLASKLDLAGGKILQIVRATDSTNRTTTSTSFVDASISVTITPQKSDSAVILIWTAQAEAAGSGGARVVNLQITDNSNNAISGANSAGSGFYYSSAPAGTTGQPHYMTLIAYATPATTSAVTYKGRFKADNQTANIFNANNTGQLFAIEVSA